MSYSLTNRKKSWFYSPVIAVILIVFVIIAGLSVVRAFAKEREAAKLRNQYQSQWNALNQRETELTTQIQNLSTDRGIEAEIRERYRVSKPGEALVVVVNNGENTPTAKKLTFWEQVRMFVGI